MNRKKGREELVEKVKRKIVIMIYFLRKYLYYFMICVFYKFCILGYYLFDILKNGIFL